MRTESAIQPRSAEGQTTGTYFQDCIRNKGRSSGHTTRLTGHTIAYRVYTLYDYDFLVPRKEAANLDRIIRLFIGQLVSTRSWGTHKY